MSNYHNYNEIISKVEEHYEESQVYFPASQQIIACVLQGSQNYGLDTVNSDVDTKLLIAPTFKELALNKKPISTTHIRGNREHIDFKDVRLYFETFKKQNINFLEVLFSSYYIVNELYGTQWKNLCIIKENIARLNPYRAVQAMRGHALDKFKKMEYKSPANKHLIDTYGYEGKQISHLVRINEFIKMYVENQPYDECIHPKKVQFIKDLKAQTFGLEEVRQIAQDSMDEINSIADKFCSETEDKCNEETITVMDNILYEIMKIAIKEELQ